MAYNIKFSSDGTGSIGEKTSFSIPDNDIDAHSTSLTLPGHGKTDYGEFFDENLVHILENFSNITPPFTPTLGQLWFNPFDVKLRVYIGTELGVNTLDPNYPDWLTLKSISGTPNTDPKCGDTYYNITTHKFFIYNCDTSTWEELAIAGSNTAGFVRTVGDIMTGKLTLPAVDAVGNEAVRFNQLNAMLTNALNDGSGGNYLVPQGGIIMWSGAIANIPTGWALCNGANGTPDLRNRFVIGAGSSYAVGGTGGSTNVTISGTTGLHTLTIAEMPSHTHNLRILRRTIDGQNDEGDSSVHPSYGAVGGFIDYAGGGQGHSHTFSDTTTVIPPYYALAYIMKL